VPFAILVDFTVAVVLGAGCSVSRSNSRFLELEGGSQAEQHRCGTDQRNFGACRDCSPNGGDSEAACDHETELGGHPHQTQPQGADQVVDFVNYLQHPLHTIASLGELWRRRREWDHTLAMVPPAAYA
jgi:hypothetical protein